jgi:hypothetical protein
MSPLPPEASEVLRRLERIEEKQDRFLQAQAKQAERIAVAETTLAALKNGIKVLTGSIIAMAAYVLKSFVESFRT